MQKFRAHHALLACLAYLVSSLAPALAAIQEERTGERPHLIVLHTNDVHGQVLPRPATWLRREDPPLAGGLPRVAAYFKKVRAEAAASGSGCVIVDAGDWYQGTPEGAIDDGLPFVSAMAAMGYDAMCVGNHEFDKGLPNLLRILEESGAPALVSNLLHGDGPVGWAPDRRIVETGGMRIGLVGLLTPQTPSITHKDTREIDFEHPASALARAHADLDSKVDWLLVLTHMGVRDDKRLALSAGLLGVDLIVGGHSHTYLKKGVKEQGVLIVQAGSKASGVGRVDVWFDPKTGEVAEMRSQVVDLYEEPEAEFRNALVEERCKELVEKAARHMSEVVGELGVPLVRSRQRFETSNAGNLITDTMRAHTGADVAMQNRGGIRCNLEAGPITRRQLFELLPFGNQVITMTLTGDQLTDLVRESVEAGSRSGIEFSGMTLEVSGNRKEGFVVEKVLVGGKPLDVGRSYRLTTNSFLATGGDGYEILAQGTERNEEPTILRELLEARFAREKKLSPTAENRYVWQR
jgi:5'-nucleotidase